MAKPHGELAAANFYSFVNFLSERLKVFLVFAEIMKK